MRSRARSHAISLDVTGFLHVLLPGGELLLRFILGDAIGFLDPAGEVVTLARNHVELVVGELAPLLLDVALELFPVAFDAIPVLLFPLG